MLNSMQIILPIHSLVTCMFDNHPQQLIQMTPMADHQKVDMSLHHQPLANKNLRKFSKGTKQCPVVQSLGLSKMPVQVILLVQLKPWLLLSH